MTRFLFFFFLLGVLGKGMAGEVVTIRLVEASNGGGGVAKELGDVASILKGQLPFNQYRLVDRNQCKLPAAKRSIKMARGYGLECQGEQDNFTVKVRHKKSEILQTTIALKDGKPLMLGGFPDDKGKLLLILLAQ